MDECQVLIVDDDPKQLKILTGHLIDHNPPYKLLIATNGKAGLEIAIKNKPDLILMDWEMPGINGIETIRMLKENDVTRNIPVIMVTGIHEEVEKMKEALDAGAIDFIKKPFNWIELNARIDSQIRYITTFRAYSAQVELINNQEKEIIEKEKAILQSELIHNQKQLTMNTVNILKQSQLLHSVTDEINNLVQFTNDKGIQIIKSIISQLNDKSSEHIWAEFEVCFEKVHTDFYRKLLEKVPDISVREKRLCAFLKLNMSTKEIVAITFQSQNAIDVAKHRMRKKIGAQTDEDFSIFLNSL